MGCPLRWCTNGGFFIARLTYRRVYQKQEYFGPDLGEAMISDILQNQSVGNRKIMSGQQRLDSLPEGKLMSYQIMFCPMLYQLVVSTSLKNISQIGFQIYGKIQFMFQTTNQLYLFSYSFSPLGQNVSPVPSGGGDGPYHTRGLAPSNPCDAFVRPVFPPWIPSEVTRL